MGKIRAVIVEDEPLAARFLRQLLHETGKVEVTGLARDGNAGLLLCSEHAPDAAFLDIRMPGADGMQLAAKLSFLQRPPMIVFTTGYADRAWEAFRLDTVDYLVKPLDRAQIWEAVCRLEARLAAGPNSTMDQRQEKPKSVLDRLPVKSGQDDVVMLLPLHEIVAAIHHHKRTWIHTQLEEFATYYSLKQLLDWMGDPPFVLVSRNAIVNLQGFEEVIHYGDRLYQVRLRDRGKTCVAASRSGAKRLAELLRPPN